MKAPGRLLRPYAITGGRARPRQHLAMEALVVTSVDDPGRGRLAMERRRVADLAVTPISVAEISAHLQVPLGVARVLVADMADEGLVRVHQPRGEDRPDVALLERVLNGIRAL